MAELSMEEIRELQRETMLRLRTRIIQDLEPRKYFSHLREKRVFDEDDTDLIRSRPTRKERSELFLDIATRHPDGFTALCQALWDARTQSHIAEELTREFQKLKQRYTENRGARIAVEKAAAERELMGPAPS